MTRVAGPLAAIICSFAGLCAVTESADASEAAQAKLQRPLRRHAVAAMHTTFELLVPDGADAVVMTKLSWPSVQADIAAVEALANEWRAGSPLAQVNANAGGAATKVPPELLALLTLALRIAALSDGAFDPSWAALWRLWRFDGDGAVPPMAAAIANRRALVGYRDVQIDRHRSTVRLPRAGMALGLGAIAKGWALDAAQRRLARAGVGNYALSAGGQVAVHGVRAPGRAWTVGIRDPRGSGPDDALLTLALRDVSVSTSGDYERFFVHDGVRYHHILDPRTGRPARGLRSASVVHPSAAMADALSTAVFVLGPQLGAALCRRLAAERGPEVRGCVLIDDHGTVRISDTLRPLVRASRIPLEPVKKGGQ